MKEKAKNVLGGTLQPCCFAPLTGYFRDGYCNTDQSDFGEHTVCCIVTEDFLKFSKSCGNDLSTPAPMYGFAGLKPGDKWCLCLSRWHEAYINGYAPQVVLEATHEKSLETVTLAMLKEHQFIAEKN